MSTALSWLTLVGCAINFVYALQRSRRLRRILVETDIAADVRWTDIYDNTVAWGCALCLSFLLLPDLLDQFIHAGYQ